MVAEMANMLKSISATRRKHPAIVHAKKVYSAISSKQTTCCFVSTSMLGVLLRAKSNTSTQHPTIATACHDLVSQDCDWSGLSGKNFHRFFRLHAEAPNMGAYLMDLYVEKLRKQALRVVCRA